MMTEAAVGSLVVAGIYLTARVASFIFGELTEEERQKQDAIRQKNQQFQAAKSSAQADLQAIQDATRREGQTYQIHYNAQLREWQIYLRRAVASRIEEQDLLKQELVDTIKKVRTALKTSTVTLMRSNSLERLLNQLQEAKARCDGYGIYLKKYQKIMNRPLGTQDDETLEDLAPFEMCIPQNFPYQGKTIWLSLDQFDKNNRWTDTSIPSISVTYQCDPSEFGWEKTDGQRAPFMVDGFNFEQHVYSVSLVKGRFMAEALRDTRMGVTALVKENVRENNRKGSILCYEKKLELFLPSNLCAKPNYPPVRAELQVYPVRWEYGLSSWNKNFCPVTVSEYVANATASLQFKNFPLVFTADQWAELRKYLEDNHLTIDMEDGWKVGPMEETQIHLAEGTRFKFQFGDALVLCARLGYSEPPDTSDRKSPMLIPFFERIMDQDQSFSSDELFVDIDVDMTPVFQERLGHLAEYVKEEETTLSKEEKLKLFLEELTLFLYDIVSELQVQRKNKLSMAGERYFQQWADVTQKLIDYHRKGHPKNQEAFEVDIETDPGKKVSKRFYTNIRVHDPEKLKTELEAYDQERKQGLPASRRKKDDLKFFAEDDRGQPCSAEIKPDCTEISLYNGDFEKILNSDRLQFYAEEKNIPELKQKQALIHLRSGRIANAQLQMAMMDGANIVPEDSGDRVKTLVNASIGQNEAQYKALCGALEEKNIFLIQGPPGTGKTTVIRELIQQYRSLHPKARVLVVSQANVAVDNALSGLIETESSHMIRCGSNEKISDEMKNISLETRYDEYMASIQERPQDTRIQQKWADFVNPQNGTVSNISELIIRNRPLVGATCVGLAKKRVGLEQLKFDLVIVDEAGKALPGEILIPVLRAKKLVLIGDHKQLPPVIDPALFDLDKIELENRQLLKHELFDISFFQRLYERTPETNRAMLETQYRMPAVIGTLVSRLFYDGKLKNGAGTESRPALFGTGNLVMYNCSHDAKYHEGKDERGGSSGIVNKREIELVTEILKRISQELPGHQVAVITPYRRQNQLLHDAWEKHQKEWETLDLAINTIDAFQGDEAKIVIYCSTRADRPTLYFSDYRRINVALSRAKNKLILIGNLKYFKEYSKAKGALRKSPLPAIAEYITNYGRIVHSVSDF